MAETMIAVRKDVAGIVPGVADGEPTPLQVTADGELRVKANLEVAVDDIDIGAVNVMNAADAIVNPATQETLETIDTGIGNIALAAGATSDVIINAGAEGSISAKLRRISADIGDASTGIGTGVDTKADVDGTGTVISHLRRIGYEADRIGDCQDLIKKSLGTVVAPSVDSFTSVKIDLAASTADQALVAAPGESKQIWVYGCFMTADTAAGTVTFQDEDDTALSGTMAVSDEGGWVLPMSGNFAMPWIKVATNKALEADTGACTVDGILTYAIVSV